MGAMSRCLGWVPGYVHQIIAPPLSLMLSLLLWLPLIAYVSWFSLRCCPSLSFSGFPFLPLALSPSHSLSQLLWLPLISSNFCFFIFLCSPLILSIPVSIAVLPSHPLFCIHTWTHTLSVSLYFRLCVCQMCFVHACAHVSA